jgi:hypothetical protein
MKNRYRFTRPPNALIRQSMKLDNVALVPGSLLPFKSEYQEIANGLPQGGIFIVLPQEQGSPRVFKQTAAQLKNKGKRIVTISAERFA